MPENPGRFNAACFENAMLCAARERKLSVDGSTVTAHVGIGRGETGRFRLDVALTVRLPGLSREEAGAVAQTAHEEIRPCSHAIRGNVDVRLAMEAAARLRRPDRSGGRRAPRRHPGRGGGSHARVKAGAGA